MTYCALVEFPTIRFLRDSKPDRVIRKSCAASVAEITRLPLTECAANARGFGFECFRRRPLPFFSGFIRIRLSDFRSNCQIAASDRLCVSDWEGRNRRRSHPLGVSRTLRTVRGRTRSCLIIENVTPCLGIPQIISQNSGTPLTARGRSRFFHTMHGTYAE
jgi:hypothetical protein